VILGKFWSRFDLRQRRNRKFLGDDQAGVLKRTDSIAESMPAAKLHCLLASACVLRTKFSTTGEGYQKGDLPRRITVTLPIFKFRTCFFAQIVENRRGRLSIPFLGHGDNFSKSYDENQIRKIDSRV
jgi:hypothetical protein